MGSGIEGRGDGMRWGASSGLVGGVGCPGKRSRGFLLVRWWWSGGGSFDDFAAIIDAAADDIACGAIAECLENS